MRVLVTGHRGYVGSVVAAVLRHAGCDVVGLDSDLYGACDFGRVQDDFPSFDMDLRDIEFTDLLSFDAVVHLAALSDDACGDIDPDLTLAVNHHATIRLASESKRAQVARFLFASSCSVYGRQGTELLNESAAVRPLTHYARSKLLCERDLAALSDESFCPTFLRLGTAYGVSPRLRLDTVVNDFVGSAIVQGRIAMRTSGAAWRPLVHVEDIARVCRAMLSAPEERIRNESFNVVPEEENHRVIDIADAVIEAVPDCARRLPKDAADQCNYRVDGSKLAEVLPRFSFRWRLAKGIRQLMAAMHNAGLTAGDWRSDRYRRALRLRALQEQGEVDSELRRHHPVST